MKFEPFYNAMPAVDNAPDLRDLAAGNGYLFFRGLLETELISQARAGALAACRRVGWLADAGTLLDGIAAPGIRAGDYNDPAYQELMREVATMPEFAEIREHPAIVSVLEKLFEGPVKTQQGDVCRVMAPGRPELTTPPHQDRFYFQEVADLWTVWLPLGDCPIELGGLAVLKGSHRQGLREHSGQRIGPHIEDLDGELVWATGDFLCGDVLMFNNLTIHRAAENRTADRLRISVDYRYRPA